ncbi:MAG TPA: alanine racemase [Gemmatimonadales bacterium]
MALSRRTFFTASLGALGAAHYARTAAALVNQQAASAGFDPWLEIDAEALRWNASAVARLAGGRPILAVLKNNAYGLGLAEVGPVLEAHPAVYGMAVVRAAEAMALRAAGVRKPVLLMGRCSEEEALELARAEVRLAAFGDDAGSRLSRVAGRLGRPLGVHLYLDTGMGRMGTSHRVASEWIAALAAGRDLRIEGVFTELTEDPDFDREQVTRLERLAAGAKARGVTLGPLHAASSAAVTHQPETHLDMVRPGLALYGGYVSPDAPLRAELRPAYRLRAPVIRVDQLQPGDGVSYHRRWKATRPTWIAVLPVGHVDGYPSGAVKGAQVLIGRRLYGVIGSVSASHTIIEVGDDPTVQVGDVATLVGGEDPAIHPNEVARRAGYSEYDMFMHLNPLLRRQVV